MVFIPKYRKKAIFGVIKRRLGDVFHELARRRESKIEEGHLMLDRWGGTRKPFALTSRTKSYRIAKWTSLL